MSVPSEAYYYDSVYGSCEPCYSRIIGGNSCVFTQDVDPRDMNWIVDDDDVFPDHTKPECGQNQLFDRVINKCRDFCPGEGSGGQQFMYADDNQSGTCECYDPAHFMFDQGTNTCLPKETSVRRLVLSAATPQVGDQFQQCSVNGGQYTNCYFPDSDSCIDVLNIIGYDPTDDGTVDPRNMSVKAAIASHAAKRRSELCPYMVCNGSTGMTVNNTFTAPRSDCVCISKQLGERIKRANKKSVRK